MQFSVTLAVVFVLAAPAIADLSAPGPFLAGVRQVSVPRPNGSFFTATVHYPALAEAVDAPFDPAAEPAPGITFGHGFLQPVMQYASTCAHLATHGFIVIASQSEGGVFPSHANFALDLRYCLDWLETEHMTGGAFLESMVDLDRFGASGHSMGGGAAILAARDDQRIVALAPLAAANTSPSSITAMSDVRTPTRLIVGSMDAIVPSDSSGVPMYEGGEAPKQLLSIQGGFHCGFTDENFLFCDSGSITRDEQLAITRRLLSEFFLLHLRQDQSRWSTVWGPQTPPPDETTVVRDPGASLALRPEVLEGTTGSRLDAAFTITNTGPIATSFTLLAEPDRTNHWTIVAMPSTTPLLPPGDSFVATLVATAGSHVESAELLVTVRRDIDGATRNFTPLILDAYPPTPDLNGDGVIDGADLGILLAAWGEGPSPADLNEDGVVDGADLGLLLATWE